MKIIKNLLLIVVLLSGLLSSATSAEKDTVEYKIKAGYLYNFIKFVTWPPDNSATFNICILGQDPFGAWLNPIETRTAFGLAIKLFRYNLESKAQACHMVFFSVGHKAVMGANDPLVSRDNRKVLTIGEGEAFTAQGGMIGFINRDGKVKLQINLKAVQQSDLTVSAKLLEVAEIVGVGNNE